MNRAIRQERILTRRTERIIQHEPTPKYFLNTFSIHNYSFIQAVVPPSLQESPSRVLPVDVDRVRTLAAQQIRQKKMQRQGQTDVGTGVPQEGSASDALACPAFDQSVSKKNTRKRGAKNPPAAASNVIQTPTAPSVTLPLPPPAVPSVVPPLPATAATYSLRSYPQMQHGPFSPPSTAVGRSLTHPQPHHQPPEGFPLHSAQIRWNHPPPTSAAPFLTYHQLYQLPPQGSQSQSAVHSAQIQFNHSSLPLAAQSSMYQLPPQGPVGIHYNGPMLPPSGPPIVPGQSCYQPPLQMRRSQLTDPQYHTGFPHYTSPPEAFH